LEDVQVYSGATIVGDQHSIEYEHKVSNADPPFIVGKVSSAKINKKETLFTICKDDTIQQKVNDRIDYLENYMVDNILMSLLEQE
jgi:hypothetical protein